MTILTSTMARPRSKSTAFTASRVVSVLSEAMMKRVCSAASSASIRASSPRTAALMSTALASPCFLMSRPMPSRPLYRLTELGSATPSTTWATSFTRTTQPGAGMATTTSSTSCTVCSLPASFTVSWPSWVRTAPAGTSRPARRMASLTWGRPTRCCSRRSWSTFTCTSRCSPPSRVISATPLSCWMRGSNLSVRYWWNSGAGMSLSALRLMMGRSFGEILDITGGWRPSGRSCRMLSMRRWASCMARSRSAPYLKFTMTMEAFARERLLMKSTRSSALRASSTGRVTLLATSSGAAPGYMVRMVMTGWLKSGIISTLSPR